MLHRGPQRAQPRQLHLLRHHRIGRLGGHGHLGQDTRRGEIHRLVPGGHRHQRRRQDHFWLDRARSAGRSDERPSRDIRLLRHCRQRQGRERLVLGDRQRAEAAHARHEGRQSARDVPCGDLRAADRSEHRDRGHRWRTGRLERRGLPGLAGERPLHRVRPEQVQVHPGSAGRRPELPRGVDDLSQHQ